MEFDGPLKFNIKYTYNFWVNYDGCANYQEGFCANNHYGGFIAIVFTDQDLGIEINVNPEVPANQDLSVVIPLSNVGTSTSQKSQIKCFFYRDNPYLITPFGTNVPPIPINKYLDWKVKIPGSLLTPAKYVIDCIYFLVDPLVPDPIYNNGAKASFKAIADTNIKDLEAYDIVIPAKIIAGENAGFEFITTAKLSETKSDGNIKNVVSYTIGEKTNSFEYTIPVSQMEADGKHVYKGIIDGTELEPGVHQIKLSVDTDDLIDSETNTNNNILQKTFEVKHPINSIEISRVDLIQNGIISDGDAIVNPNLYLEVQINLQSYLSGKKSDWMNETFLLHINYETENMSQHLQSFTISVAEFLSIKGFLQKSFVISSDFLEENLKDKATLIVKTEFNNDSGFSNMTKFIRITKKQDYYIKGWGECQKSSKDINNFIIVKRGKYYAEELTCQFFLVDKNEKPIENTENESVFVYENFNHLYNQNEEEPVSYAWRRRYYFDIANDPFEHINETNIPNNEFKALIQKTTVQKDGSFKVVFSSKSWYVPKLDQTTMDGQKKREVKETGPLKTPETGHISFTFPLIKSEKKYFEIFQWSSFQNDKYRKSVNPKWFDYLIKDVFLPGIEKIKQMGVTESEAVAETFNNLDISEYQRNSRATYKLYVQAVGLSSVSGTTKRESNNSSKIMLNPYYREIRHDLFQYTYWWDWRWETNHSFFDLFIHESRHAFQQANSWRILDDGMVCSEDFNEKGYPDIYIKRACAEKLSFGAPEGPSDDETLYNLLKNGYQLIGSGFLVDDDKNLYAPTQGETVYEDADLDYQMGIQGEWDAYSFSKFVEKLFE